MHSHFRNMAEAPPDLNLATAGEDFLRPMLATAKLKNFSFDPDQLQAHAAMSRRRFVTVQCTSFVGALLFVFAVGLYTLSQVLDLSAALLDEEKCAKNSTSLLCRLVNKLSTL